MKRRSFLQAVGGAIAALFVPVVAAKTTPITRTESWFEDNEPSFWEYHPPETLSELRAAIESQYETVHELKRGAYEESEPLISGFGLVPTVRPVVFEGPYWWGFTVMGRGDNEREAVADAFKSVRTLRGSKEMMWRRKLSLDKLRFFEENKTEFVVRGRVVVRK